MPSTNFTDQPSYIGGSYQAIFTFSAGYPISAGSVYTNLRCALESVNIQEGENAFDDNSWCSAMDKTTRNRLNWKATIRFRKTSETRLLLKEIRTLRYTPADGLFLSQGPWIDMSYWLNGASGTARPSDGYTRLIGRVTDVNEDIPNEKSMFEITLVNEDYPVMEV